jgi:hypothetical protein
MGTAVGQSWRNRGTAWRDNGVAVSRGGHGAAGASSDEFAHPGESQYIDESQYMEGAPS